MDVNVISSWNKLDTLWEGGPEVIQMGLPHEQLAPSWQILLLGDGSPTRHLKLLTSETIAVDVIEMSGIGDLDVDGLRGIEIVGGPRIRRQVWLKTASGQRLAYAVSWWDQGEVDDYFQNRSLPIWDNLSRLHKELYRDIQGVYYGYNGVLEVAFNEVGPFWGRHYVFWHQAKPITLIYEVFSPYLRKYLGGMQML